jgi:Tol biopolymer transport system component
MLHYLREIPDNQGRSIQTINADGSDPKQVVGDIANGAPQWSPDGTKIAFCTQWDDKGTDMFEITTVNADGSGLKHLTRTSPTVKLIAVR